MRYGGVSDTYEDARLKAKEDFWKQALKGKDGYVPTFEEAANGYSYTYEPRVAYRGFLSTCLIKGSNQERKRDFSLNYLPLVKRDRGDFRQKWVHVKNNIPQWLESGNPIEVKEFMHQYYVMQGNKRTSVAKYLDMPELDAVVFRAIPDKNQNDKDVQLYHEFLEFENRTGLDMIWFSEEGKFDELEEIISSYAPKNMNRYDFFKQYMFKPFHQQYHFCKNGNKKTEGDIFLEYIKEIPDILVDDKELQNKVKEVVKRHKRRNRVCRLLDGFKGNGQAA